MFLSCDIIDEKDEKLMNSINRVSGEKERVEITKNILSLQLIATKENNLIVKECVLGWSFELFN